MKKILLIVFTLMFIASLMMAVTSTVTPTRSSASNDKGERLETIAWQETFENGENGWTYTDATSPDNMWRNYNSTADGWVWWMGDTALASGNNIGGYLSHQYLVLDTPAITVPTTTPTLTFRVKYKVESPSGATAPYTGWDACDVRISTNGGTTWTVISGTPAYNVSSSYAFGFEHGEGANIAGWGGASTGWQNASFSLSAYAGQSVKIRFAFASDPAYDTTDDATMFGMMVDDIHLGDFTNDGSTNTGFTASSLVPLGGQLWHVGTEATAPSPTHAMICQNGQGSYNVNMLDYVTSPSIVLPAIGQIKADFQIQGDFTDTGVFPDVDYWGWEISPDNGGVWYPMSNPYNDPNGNNYVYSDAPPTWASAVESYSLDGMLSDYAGQTVKFRMYFKSNATVAGTGVMIDDFTIYNVLFLAPPTSLVSTSTAGVVDLAWTAPIAGVTPSNITSTNENWTSFVSDADSYAMKITNPNAAETQLHGINFMLYRQNSMPIIGTPTIHVWADAAGLPGTELLNVPDIAGAENFVWKNVDITSYNIMIPASGSVFIGISGIDAGDTNAQGLLCDASSTTANSFANTAGAWATLGSTYVGPPPLVNCGLSGTIWTPDPNAPTLTGYKVFHSLDGVAFSEIATITSPTTVTYTDNAPASGVLNYYQVTGVYNANQSDPSNISSIFVLGADFTEIQYDDNDWDSGYNVGATHSMAVKFSANPTVGHGSQIQFVKIYVTTVGTTSMIIRIWDADGADGMPGTQLLQFTYAATGIVQGWNTIAMPTSNLITDTDGVFYIGILEFVGASAIALDADTHNSSWKRMTTTGPWEQITDGNLLIRAIVRSVTGNDDPAEIAPVMNLSNYPNPFNPNTTISFNVPKAGTGSVKIYNVKGQLVRNLASGNLTVGLHKIVWDGSNDNGQSVGSGVYFTKFETAGKTLTQKMVLLK
jgi:hypothetical protein